MFFRKQKSPNMLPFLVTCHSQTESANTWTVPSNESIQTLTLQGLRKRDVSFPSLSAPEHSIVHLCMVPTMSSAFESFICHFLLKPTDQPSHFYVYIYKSMMFSVVYICIYLNQLICVACVLCTLLSHHYHERLRSFFDPDVNAHLCLLTWFHNIHRST